MRETSLHLVFWNATLALASLLAICRCGSPDGNANSVQNTGGGITYVTPASVTNAKVMADIPARASSGGFYVAGSGYSDTYDSVFGILMKLTSDGSVDTTFGDRGQKYLPLPAGAKLARIQHFVAMGDGSVVLAAESADLKAALIKYRADGSLDTSFGQLGFVSTLCDLYLTVAMRFQPDGKLLVACMESVRGQSYGILERYNSNGSLDTSFDPYDLLRTRIGTLQDMQLLSDGNIVLMASSHVLMKVDSSGNLVNGFPSDASGLVYGDRLTATNDSLWIVGTRQHYDKNYNLAGTDALSLMVDLSGSLHGTYGTGGVSQFPIIDGTTPLFTGAPTICERPDGKSYLFATGYSSSLGGASSTGELLIRLINADGSVDTTFGSGGTELVPITGFYSPYFQVGECDDMSGIVSVGVTADGVASLAFNPSTPAVSLSARPLQPH